MIKARIKRFIITLGKLSKTLSKPTHFSAEFYTSFSENSNLVTDIYIQVNNMSNILLVTNICMCTRYIR